MRHGPLMAIGRSGVLLIGITIAMLVSAAAFPSTTDRNDPPPEIAEIPDAYLQQLEQAEALAESSAGDPAEPALIAVLDDPAFSQLPAERRFDLLILAGYNAAIAGQLELARQRVTRAVATDSRQPNGWYQLAMIEADLENGSAAAAHLTHLARTWPELVNQLGQHQLWHVVSSVERGSDARLTLLQAFFDAGWDRRPASASGLWYGLALQRLERGEIEIARQVVQSVNHPNEVVSMLMDKRFAPVAAVQWDPLAKGAALVDTLRARAAATPADLEAQTELLETLLVMGGHQEILDISGPILDELEAADRERPIHYQNWIANHRSIALLRLGRTDEALAQLVAASKMPEGASGNTSQLLNLALLYSRLDMPEQARDALSRVEHMSDYGRMVEAGIRHAVSVRRGDLAASAEALEYLREQRDDAPSIYLQALLTADLLDEAVAAVIELLRSPDDRTDTLFWLQELRQPPRLPGDGSVRERWQQLRDDPKVRAEVELVGSMGTYPVYDG